MYIDHRETTKISNSKFCLFCDALRTNSSWKVVPRRPAVPVFTGLKKRLKSRIILVYLLYILGPFRRITEGHESTVGQDGEHDQHAEHRGDKVKDTCPIIHLKTFPFISNHKCLLLSSRES